MTQPPLAQGPPPLPPPRGAVADARVSGKVVPDPVTPPPTLRETGTRPALPGGAAAASPPQGDVNLNFVDADIREVVRVILGEMLKVNYAIDPGVQGTTTIQTARPIRSDQLLPLLQNLLADNHAELLIENGFYRVAPLGLIGTPLVRGGELAAGSEAIPLRFASAKQLEKVLTPFAGDTGHVAADPASNTIVVTGTARLRQSIVDLIRVFDVDYLAKQSYALFPIKSGDPGRVATALEQFFATQEEGALAGVVRIVPIDRVNAVLVVAPQPSYLDRAGRFIAQLDLVRDSTARGLHVYYVQNGQAGDLEPVLQRIFTPGAVTRGGGRLPGSVVPTGDETSLTSPGGQRGGGGSAIGQGVGRTGAGQAGQGGQLGIQGQGGAFGQGGQYGPFGGRELGELDTEADLGADQGTGGRAQAGIRIVADRRKNALVILATDSEYAMIEPTLRKLDVLPLQVLIEATVAEVTLNDALRYGTQFFFKGGDASGVLTNAVSGTTSSSSGVASNAAAFASALAPTFPGFAISRTIGGAQYAVQALQSVTDVKVISAPHLMIVDNQRARLQVGDLVPIITQSAVSTLTAGAPVVNSVDYRETGVILQVRPRINSGGLVTLDIDQEVSDVVQTTSSTINSPTFSQRRVASQVVVQDGDTIGLAGLIRDNDSRSNSGIPVLREIPVLGPLFSTQTNTATRTELLVLLTPHVVHDYADARAVTEELRRKLPRPGILAPPPLQPAPAVAAPVPQPVPPLSVAPLPPADLSRPAPRR